MIANMEYVTILDDTDKLAEMLLHSDVMENYLEKKIALANNKEAQDLIQAFNHIKEHYEDVQRFGRYHPDYQDIMKKVRATKRAMDMHDAVAAYKVAERHLQELLDSVSEQIAHSVSDKIIVPKDGVLSDSCGCGSGGSCGCAS